MAVSVSDVAAELGRPAPDSTTSEQWQGWIERAYRLIQRRFRAAYPTLDPVDVDDVVLQAVAQYVRSWRDDSASQYTVSVDDGSVSKSYQAAAGPLAISDDLWAILLPPDLPAGRVGSIRLGVPSWRQPRDGL